MQVHCFYIDVDSFFFFKLKTAYEMRISDWSSDVCSSDLQASDGGILRLFFGTYDQVDGAEAGTIQALDGSTVHIENTGVTILGGALNSAAGGQVLVRNSPLALDGTDIDNQGSFFSNSTLTMTGGDLDNGGVMSFDEDAFLVLKGTSVTNSGTIELSSRAQAVSGNDAFGGGLLIDGAATLSGGGRLVLGGPADAVVFEPDQDPDLLRARSFIGRTGAGGTLTNENHTIEGTGQPGLRSEERRGGKECVNPLRFRWSPYH